MSSCTDFWLWATLIVAAFADSLDSASCEQLEAPNVLTPHAELGRKVMHLIMIPALGLT